MRILFLANVDWFFQSHFLYLARRAQLNGWDVALAAHINSARESLTAEGLELIELPTRRGRFTVAAYSEASAIVLRELRRRPDTLLHGFGLFGIAVGGMASRRVAGQRSLYTITGRGYSAIGSSLRTHLLRIVSRSLCANFVDGPRVRWFAENMEDLAACGLSSAVRQSRTALLGGAGVEPADFSISPMPRRKPFRVALVARMIWSKGIDTAVEAVQIARASGIDITLTLAGPLDSGNPRAYSEQQLRDFESLGGVRWLGRIDDINTLWASHHAAVLPSLGGEGLPKSLIEAAVCGRPIITTRVSGCGAFAEATGGWSVLPGSAANLAIALVEACEHAELANIGLKAREFVLSSCTHDHNWRVIDKFYGDLSERRAETS